jgi:hypothetical protein
MPLDSALLSPISTRPQSGRNPRALVTARYRQYARFLVIVSPPVNLSPVRNVSHSADRSPAGKDSHHGPHQRSARVPDAVAPPDSPAGGRPRRDARLHCQVGQRDRDPAHRRATARHRRAGHPGYRGLARPGDTPGAGPDTARRRRVRPGARAARYRRRTAAAPRIRRLRAGSVTARPWSGPPRTRCRSRSRRRRRTGLRCRGRRAGAPGRRVGVRSALGRQASSAGRPKRAKTSAAAAQAPASGASAWASVRKPTTERIFSPSRVSTSIAAGR